MDKIRWYPLKALPRRLAQLLPEARQLASLGKLKLSDSTRNINQFQTASLQGFLNVW